MRNSNNKIEMDFGLYIDLCDMLAEMVNFRLLTISEINKATDAKHYKVRFI